MTRTDYLAALEKSLKILPEADYKEAMDYFTEYFEDAGSENEALVIKELGDPRDAAEEIIRSLSAHSTEEIVQQNNHLRIFILHNMLATLISLKITQPSLNCILI